MQITTDMRELICHCLWKDFCEMRKIDPYLCEAVENKDYELTFDEARELGII